VTYLHLIQKWTFTGKLYSDLDFNDLKLTLKLVC